MYVFIASAIKTLVGCKSAWVVLGVCEKIRDFTDFEIKLIMVMLSYEIYTTFHSIKLYVLLH